MKEQIIKIIGHVLMPKLAELQADEILTLFDKKTKELIKDIEEILNDPECKFGYKTTPHQRLIDFLHSILTKLKNNE